MNIEQKFLKQQMLNDAVYANYMANGSAIAEYLTKDVITGILTDNKCVDVIKTSTYKKRGQIAFNYFIVELFPRYKKPDLKSCEEENIKSYIEWQTEQQDIMEQRSKGVQGAKYLVIAYLYNKNKGRVLKGQGIWNKKLKRWEASWDSSCEYRDRVVFVPPATDNWQYQIRAIKKINNKQYRHIINNDEKIVESIKQNRNTDISYFGL